VGGVVGAGIGALTGQSADLNDPLSKGTRGRNALIGGGAGALLGGAAGYMSDKGLAGPKAPGVLPSAKGPGPSPTARAALQLNPGNQDVINRADYLGGQSSHDPSSLAGGSSGMGGLDQHVQQSNAAAVAPFSHIPEPSGTRYMDPTALAATQPAPRAATVPLSGQTTAPVPYSPTQPIPRVPTEPGVRGPQWAPTSPFPPNAQYTPYTPSSGQDDLGATIAAAAQRMRDSNEAALQALNAQRTAS
jgi:hypothetical protein